MSWDTFYKVVGTMHRLGAKAYTITGGGEPLMHPKINGMLRELLHSGMKIGLVSNGIALKKVHEKILKQLSWIRVSWHTMRDAVPDTSMLEDHAFSVVYAPGDELDPRFLDLVTRAMTGQLTHLRVVSDITRAQDDGYSSAFRVGLRSWLMDPNPNVIIQPRDNYTKGSKRCWISLIKPVVDVDGQVYPCCGSQYAMDLQTRKMPKKMSMGDINQYRIQHIEPQVPFDGSKCKYCYYKGYNDFLDAMVFKEHIQHAEFL